MERLAAKGVVTGNHPALVVGVSTFSCRRKESSRSPCGKVEVGLLVLGVISDVCRGSSRGVNLRVSRAPCVFGRLGV